MSFILRVLTKVFGEPRKLYDDFFGEMIDADGYYECFAYFKPIGKKIELGIGGDENGPTKEARMFYKEIEKNYGELIEILAPEFLKNLLLWNPETKITSFKKEFEPVYMFIPDFKTEKLKWEIAFETIHNSHLIRAEMKGYEVEVVIIDG